MPVQSEAGIDRGADPSVPWINDKDGTFSVTQGLAGNSREFAVRIFDWQ
jgi:hypothetical protein